VSPNGIVEKNERYSLTGPLPAVNQECEKLFREFVNNWLVFAVIRHKKKPLSRLRMAIEAGTAP
jgi:hypothetical protein